MNYVGFKINAEGVNTDSGKLKTMVEFPTPTCLTDLRCFMGLINQLGDFTTEVSTTADPLRDLLKSKNEFRCTETYTTAFQVAKDSLVSAPTLVHFDPSKPTVVELELLAAIWATKKCRIQILGLPHFQLVVDHKPLVTILDRHLLDDIDNTRLQRLKEKTSLLSLNKGQILFYPGCSVTCIC